MITIAGLGFGEKYAVTLEALKAMRDADRVILRTSHHPSVEILKEENIEFESLDFLYEETEEFDKLYTKIAEYVYENSKNKNVCYVVPGSPSIAESTVKRLRQMTKDIVYVDAVSFIEPCFGLANIDPVEGALFLDAMDVNYTSVNPNLNIMITQAWNEFLLSDLKINLMQVYDDEKIIYAITDAGIKGKEECKKVRLFELDREVVPDIRLTLIIPAEKNCGMMNFMKQAMSNEPIKNTGYNELDEDRDQLYKILNRIGKNIDEGLYEFKELFDEV